MNLESTDEDVLERWDAIRTIESLYPPDREDYAVHEDLLFIAQHWRSLPTDDLVRLAETQRLREDRSFRSDPY